jgi:hypothetical protein
MNICITSCGRSSVTACALLLHGLAVLPSFAQGTITQTEPNDSIATATLTGIAAGSSVLKVTQGHSGDGPFGEFGDMSGDVDFFKVSANAGQTILVNMANGGIDADFDPYAAIYDAAGTLVAEGDDKGNTPRGYDRTPSFTYPVTVSGDYYVCVSNWVENTTSLPSDPTTPGSGPGLASGNSGPYQLVIGLDAELPVVQFVGGVSGYPVPAFLPDKIFGTPRREGILTISNRSAGTTPASALTITGFNITGPDASRYFVKGLLPPVTIPAGGSLDVPIAFNAVGMDNEAQATLNLVSNDPLSQAYSLNTFSPVEGGGFFQVKQVNAPAGTAVNNFDIADQLLDGTIEGGTVFTGTTSRINYGAGNGRFGSDLPFLNGGTTPENIVLQVTGPVNIRADGDYTFFGISDDGQRLRINGQEVFQNTGYDQDTFGTVNLTAGIHQIEYTMYEGGGGNHAELAITQQPISISSFVSATWELLEAAGADTDGDGMPDAYESANGLSISSAAGNDGASGDPDADGSSNANEYFLGTNPKLPDTDSDGLLDGVESGTGVWAGPGNTGTDPLIADTDLDGLLDGVEHPGLASTGLSQPGTSPVRKDTDNDGVADAIEITLGSDPLSAASVPAAFTFKPMLSEDFDGDSFHSTFAINRLNGTETFEPKVDDSFDLIHQFTAKLTGSSTSNHNTITWDYVDGPSAPALQISVDFRMGSDGGTITNPADGFGIGLFRKSVYGTSGISPTIVDSKSWENPAGGGGYADALFFGFGVYGTDSIRVLGPAAPAEPLAVQFPTFPLVNDLFNRAIITVVSNTPNSSMVKLEMIMDVDGVATTHTVFENVLVPGFVVSGEEVRLIAGARTGGLFTPVEIDNVKVSVPDQVTPSVVLSNTFNSFLVDIYDGTAAASIVNPGSITAAVNGNPVTVSPVKTGAVTTIDYAEAQGGIFPPGTNTLVINYTSTTGAVFQETRSLVIPSYFLLPPALAVSPARGFIPGFGIKTWQCVPITAGQTLPGSIDYAEALLGGAHGNLFTGANEADLTLADGNAVFIRETINFEQASGAAGYFGGDVNVPGIPGIQGSTDNYILEALVWVEFPAAGLYNLGVNADDGFRLSVGHAPVTPLLSVAVPAAAARVVAAVPSVLNEGGAFGTLPTPPLTRKLVVAVPPLADVALTNGAEMAGNIALVERGNVTFATKIKNAQDAGAVGVIIYNNTANEAALPFAMGGDATITGITISGIMVSRSDGLSLAALAAAPGGVEVQYGSDRSTTVGFANPNAITNFTVGVSTPGLYPLRFLNFEGGGGANAEIYSVDAFGVRHLVNDPFDVDALKAYAVLADGPAAILTRTVAGELLIHFKGILQGSPDLGSFSDIVGVDSPYVIPAGTTGRMFFRARP